MVVFLIDCHRRRVMRGLLCHRSDDSSGGVICM